MDESRKGNSNTHIPFRQSKLTLALRDSFVETKGKLSKMIMIGCVSPGSSFTDYSLNTLWYASKLSSQKKSVQSKYANGAFNPTMSLNTSHLGKGINNLNSSFDEKEKQSILNTDKNMKRTGSSDSESINVKDGSALKKKIPLEDKRPSQKVSSTSQRKFASSQHHLGRSLAARPGNLVKRETQDAIKKNNFIKTFEADKKDKSKEEPQKSAQTKDHFDPEEIFSRYIDSLKWESDIIRQESKIMADTADDWEISFKKNKIHLMNHIEKKINMLKKLHTLVNES